MKKHLRRIFFLCTCTVLFFRPIILEAKTGTHEFYRNENAVPQGWIFTAFASEAYFNYLPQHGTLDVSFPYHLTNEAQVVTNKQFTSHNIGLTGTGKWVNPSVGLEIGKENFSVEGQLGWYIHNWSDNIYGGVNYRFILHKVHAQPERLVLGGVSVPGKKFTHEMGSFPVKISLGIYYYQPVWQLGTINTGTQQLNALGYTMNSLDSASSGDAEVTVLYHQNIVALRPSFSFGYAPLDGRLELSFSASPMITLSEVGGLRFYLKSTNAIDWVPRDGLSVDSVIPLDTVALHADYNGEKINSTPFHLKGVMYTFKIGFRIGS